MRKGKFIRARERKRKEWAKQMALEKRRAALLEKFGSSMGVGIIGSSCPPPLLPPLEGTPLGNLDLLWSTSVFFECPACPPRVDNLKTKIPIGLLEQHRAWHARVNALIGLRARTKDAGGNAQHFGPGFPGILAMLEYTYKVRKKVTKVLGKWMARGEFVMKKRMKPLVILRYVDGLQLQYTVGNTFLGRQKQGEFVFFDMEGMAVEDENDVYESDSDSGDDDDSSDEEEKSDDDKEVEASDDEEQETEDVGSTDANKEENYFTLTCKYEGIWISKNQTEASCPSTIVSVNGIPLVQDQAHPCCQGEAEAVSQPINHGECHCKRRLEFGDVVSISQGKGGNFIDFLVMASTTNEERGSDSEEEGGNDSSNTETEELVVANNATAVLENPLVLQNILHFLSTTKLQSFRSLSQIWNTKALKALRSRVTVKLFNGSIKSDDPMQISTYAFSLVNALRFPHWKLELNPHWRACHPSERQRSMGDKKLAEDFAWFFDPQSHTHTHNVKSLTLFSDRAVASCTHLALYETVLRAPGMKKHLTSLYLSFDFGYFSYKSALPPALEEMPSLRNLTLCIGGTKRLEQCFFDAFNETFLSAVGSIRSLKLTKPINDPHLATFPSFVLSGIGQLQPLKFQYLSHVFLANGGDGHIGPLATLRKGSLKSLTLLECNSKLIFSTPLRLVLDRHGDSLEELSLHFEDNLFINFPYQMPKLRSLEILLTVTGRTRLFLAPRFRFGGLESLTWTSIDYRSVFPSLQCLTVWPVAVAIRHYGYRSSIDDDIPIKSVLETGWGTFLPILIPFVTPSSSPVHSLRRVEVPFLLEDKYNSILDNLERTFPSTQFPPSLADARLRPVWMPPPRPPRPRSPGWPRSGWRDRLYY